MDALDAQLARLNIHTPTARGVIRALVRLPQFRAAQADMSQESFAHLARTKEFADFAAAGGTPAQLGFLLATVTVE